MKNLVNINTIKSEIIKRLKPLNLDRVILFGSYSYGTYNKDSDIDLYVVTKDQYIPQSFRENIKLYKSVAKSIRDLRGQIAIDLIVHTKTMHDKFKRLNSSFSREIFTNGIVLI